ncbi:MAG: T9SS type A sorting domain-containing protein [Bacteroidota bacterium]
MRSFLFFILLYPYIIVSQSPYNVYYGNLHSHTDYSGGVGNPRQAFIYARDTAQLDFLAVTDHLEGIYYSSYEWDSTMIMADEITVDGTFIGIAGYEWTSPTYNHCNIYNTLNKVSPNNLNNWSTFVQSVVDEIPAFAQFNHPGMIGSNDWNSLTNMGTLADSVFTLIEINNSSEESGYIMALDSNWHVSPSNGQDNHDADWGTKDDGRTGIWSDQLTRTDLFDAIIAGRTFATFDKNASVWIDIGGIPMGGRITYISNIPVHIVMNDENAEQWSYIQLVGAGGQVFCNLLNHGTALDTIITINPSASKWIYVRAKQADDQYIYSAPFYIIGLPVAAGNFFIDDFFISVYPNPLIEASVVKFNIEKSEDISVKILDISGREVAEVVSGSISSGIHQYSLPYEKMNEGFYFLKYTDNNHLWVLKLIR